MLPSKQLELENRVSYVHKLYIFEEIGLIIHLRCRYDRFRIKRALISHESSDNSFDRKTLKVS